MPVGELFGANPRRASRRTTAHPSKAGVLGTRRMGLRAPRRTWFNVARAGDEEENAREGEAEGRESAGRKARDRGAEERREGRARVRLESAELSRRRGLRSDMVESGWARGKRAPNAGAREEDLPAAASWRPRNAKMQQCRICAESPFINIPSFTLLPPRGTLLRPTSRTPHKPSQTQPGCNEKGRALAGTEAYLRPPQGQVCRGSLRTVRKEGGVSKQLGAGEAREARTATTGPQRLRRIWNTVVSCYNHGR